VKSSIAVPVILLAVSASIAAAEKQPIKAASNTAKALFFPLYAEKEAIRIGFSKDKTPRIGREHAIGYLAIAGGAYAMNRAYFFMGADTFQRKTDAILKAAPKRVLVINSFPEDEEMFHLDVDEFVRKQRLLGSEVTELQASQYDDLLRKLRGLPQANQFDRIEFYVHGKAGKIAFRGDTPVMVDQAALSPLRDLKLRIAAPGAELRLSSCAVAAADSKTGETVGKTFINELGKALLPDGGSVVATEKIVLAMTLPGRFTAHSVGLGVPLELRNFLFGALKLKFPKGYIPRKDVVKITIPAQTCIGPAIKRIRP